MRDVTPPCKMDTPEAERVWNGMTYQQKVQFAEFYPLLISGQLKLDAVNVDENEKVKNIVLVPKEQIGIPDKPFYKHFK
jgi:hypothetical protein